MNVKFDLMILILLGMLLQACSSDFNLMKMEETLNGYGSAIRWGAFEKAVDYQIPSRRSKLDLAWLKNIRVTSYDTLYRKEAKGSNIFEQTVEIRYYNDLQGVEKTITDRQLWHYDDEKDQWSLESELPHFN
ncbi:MAG: hypothetical protein PHE55_00475 [Methylococcaceae bacterium]|nr:hypothetical protein [Methylococcaceae bacterium]